jgi:hypothetical protein
MFTIEKCVGLYWHVFIYSLYMWGTLLEELHREVCSVCVGMWPPHGEVYFVCVGMWPPHVEVCFVCIGMCLPILGTCGVHYLSNIEECS